MSAAPDLTVLTELVRTGKLTPRQQTAVAYLSRTVAGERGRSCPVTNYSGLPRSGNRSSAPNVYWTREADTVEALKRRLHPHERDLLSKVCTPTAKPWEVVIAIGAEAGYKQIEQTRAVGVGRIQALMDTVAEFFGVASEERAAA